LRGSVLRTAVAMLRRPNNGAYAPLFVILYFFELGVDDVVLAAVAGVSVRAAALLLGLGLLLGVPLLRQAAGGFGQLVGGRLDGVLVLGLDRLLHVLDGGFDFGLFVLGHLVAGLGQRLLGGVDQALGGVARL